MHIVRVRSSTPVAVQSPTRPSHYQPATETQDAAAIEASYKRTIIMLYWYEVRGDSLCEYRDL